MEAFIPCGAPLVSSRAFVKGTTPIPSGRNASYRSNVTTEISAIKLPKLPSLPSLPSFSKKDKPAAPPTPTNLIIGGKNVAPMTPEERATQAKMAAVASASAGGSPGGIKFYNPTTARYQFRADSLGQCDTPYDVRRGERGVKPESVRDNDQGGFRNMDLYTDDLVRARPDWSSDEARVSVKVALRNVFGNANLFESEVAELATSISCVTETGDMREFVRALALSSAYRKRFFEPCSNMRFVELNFKHFLGRAPRNQAEVSAQIQILATQGYNAAVNAIIDSDEYDRLFGKSRLPAVNFRGGHQYNNDMNKLAILNGSYVASDRVSRKAALASGDASGFTPFGVYRGLPEAWRGENQGRDEAGTIMAFPDSMFWKTSPPGVATADLAWRVKYGSWVKFWYKDSVVYKEVMTPVRSHSAEETEAAAATLKYGSLMSKKYVS